MAKVKVCSEKSTIVEGCTYPRTVEHQGKIYDVQTVEEFFTVETGDFSWKGMDIDKVVTFYDKVMKVEAEYFYYKQQCNYLLSWGFEKESLGESRKRKAHKVKKPFFTLGKGWYGYE